MFHCRCTNCTSGAFFRVVYDDSYTDDYVVLRAKKTYGQKKYDIFEQNCEHSARWCKTGIHESSQIGVCFTTLRKAALVVFLRLISLIVLWLLQWWQEQDESLNTMQERIITVVYMSATACLFIVYSLYHGCAAIHPTAPHERHDADISQVESAQLRCAKFTHRYCCCSVQKCNVVVMGLCCASCFFCSLFYACCSSCCKHIQCGQKMICRRPKCIVVGLFFRIFVREIIAAAGPFLVVYFEDNIVLYIGNTLGKFFAILGLIIGTSLVAYVVGALFGVLLEALIILCCANCCCRCSAPDNDGGNENDNANLVVNDTLNQRTTDGV